MSNTSLPPRRDLRRGSTRDTKMVDRVTVSSPTSSLAPPQDAPTMPRAPMTRALGDRIKVALVGAGYIADIHLEALRELDWVDVVAVCDPSRTRAESLARRAGTSQICASIEELIDLPQQPDAAHLLAPPPLHESLTRQLIDAGIAAFVEKPLGLSEAACAQLVEHAKKAKVPLGVNHNMVFHQAVAELKKRLDANAIGPPQFVFSLTNLPLRQLSMRQFGHWLFAEPQNILFEAACHPFSVLHELLGELQDARTSVGERLDLPSGPFFKSWRCNLDCERGQAMAYLSLGREFLASKLLVVGPDGSLEADLVTGSVRQGHKTKFPEFWDIASNDRRNGRALRRNARRRVRDYALSLFKIKPRSDLYYMTMRDSIRAFHEDLRAGRELRMGGDSGRGAVRYCEKVFASVADEFASAKPAVIAASEGQADKAPASVKTSESKHVLVTGATGFIGSHLAERLAARGHRVRALVRTKGYVPDWLQHDAIEVVTGDMHSRESLERAFDGVDAVAHLATALYENWEDTLRGNLDPTRTMAEIARSKGIERFVFTSTIAALYLGDAGDTIRGEDPVDPKPDGRSLYARGKIACEKMLAEEAGKGLPLVTMRPALVVGTRGRTRHSGVGYWPVDNHCLAWGAGQNELPFVLAGDVADAIIASIERADSVGKNFNLVGDVRISAEEYVRELRAATSRPIEFHTSSLWWMQLVDIFKWGVKLAARKKPNAFPSYRDLKTRALLASFDTSEAREVLGWTPCADRERFLQEGLIAPIAEGG